MIRRSVRTPCHRMQRHKKNKAGTATHADVTVTAAPGVKRPAAGPQPAGAAGKKAKNVLESLFHEDGGGAQVVETYCCRSIGARGLNLS